MNSKDFNAMLAAARAMLKTHREGVKLDEHAVKWAQALVVANPTDKRRPSPMRDCILEMFEGREGSGLRRDDISASMHPLPGPANLAAMLHDMTHREPVYLWMHRRKGQTRGRYYVTRKARDDAADADAASLSLALEARAKERAARLAKNDAAFAARAVAKAQEKAQKKAESKPRYATTRKTASGSAGSPPSPTIAPNDPRIQRAVTPRGRYEVTEADLQSRIFTGTALGTNPMTGRAWE